MAGIPPPQRCRQRPLRPRLRLRPVPGLRHRHGIADAYARSGNLVGSETSPLVLGDYKVDKDAEQEHPTRVAIIDAHRDTLQLVELGSYYWFRSLGRGPNGEGLVLTYDGYLQVIDMVGGTVTKKIPVISPWEEKIAGAHSKLRNACGARNDCVIL